MASVEFSPGLPPGWRITPCTYSEPLGITPCNLKPGLHQVAGLKGLSYLLANWEDETTLCNIAEVQRGLLESKNKQVLPLSI